MDDCISVKVWLAEVWKKYCHEQQHGEIFKKYPELCTGDFKLVTITKAQKKILKNVWW